MKKYFLCSYLDSVLHSAHSVPVTPSVKSRSKTFECKIARIAIYIYI
jgi:hypothetical protein